MLNINIIYIYLFNISHVGQGREKEREERLLVPGSIITSPVIGHRKLEFASADDIIAIPDDDEFGRLVSSRLGVQELVDELLFLLLFDSLLLEKQRNNFIRCKDRK